MGLVERMRESEGFYICTDLNTESTFGVLSIGGKLHSIDMGPELSDETMRNFNLIVRGPVR